MSHRNKFFLLFLICIAAISNYAEAKNQTIKVYSDASDGSIETAPYPGSWSVQYFSKYGVDTTEPNTQASSYVGAYNSILGYLGIRRAFLSFNTSMIPANANVISAKLVIYPNFVSNEFSDSFSYENILQGFQASSTQLTYDDIEKCGNQLIKPAKGADDIPISNISENLPLQLILNTVGMSWINRIGYTKLCLREGHDIENKETINNSDYWRVSGISFYTSEAANPDFRPYLEIAYSLPDEKLITIFDVLHELVAQVSADGLSKHVIESYMANLGKIEDMLNAANYGPVRNQISAFEQKLAQDLKQGVITQAIYDDLIAKADAFLAKLPAAIVPNVPLITQVVSPYPSVADTTSWADAMYAGGRASTTGDCGLTIKQCGCALTSLAMIGKYYGIGTGVDGSAVNPLNMNNWLLGHGGYTDNGTILWNYALAYMGEDKNGKVMTTLSLDGYNETSPTAIGSFVDKGQPSLGFSAAKGHYVTLKATNGAGYFINDPFWYNTKATDDVRDVANHVQNYNNTIDKAELISHSTALHPLPSSIEIVLGSPAELLLIDGMGRRLGYDAQGGTVVNEIPGGSYDQADFVLDPTNPSSDPHRSKRLLVTKPSGTAYELKVIGTGSGEYHLTTALSDGMGGLIGDRVTKNTSVGTTDTYTVVVVNDGTELPLYLKNILALIPTKEHKKFTQAFSVVFAQTEKGHVAVTHQLIENLVTYIGHKYPKEAWSTSVVSALKGLL